MTDQQALWNRKHNAGEHAKWSDEPREFAVKIIEEIKPGMNLLELGCGVGSDARFFAKKGINVLATDFSDVAVKQNIERGVPKNLKFTVLDMAHGLTYGNETFDVVYAYLSLHYYDEQKTKAIFQDIYRVLKTGGKLYFSCKSIHDHKFGQGERLGPGIFITKGAY